MVVVGEGGVGGREWRPADQAHSLVNHVDEMPCEEQETMGY